MAATMTIKDLTPKFLKFYEMAQGADPDRRWELWHDHYEFAAVPPTDAGSQRARQMLDETWHRYPEVLDVIRAGAAGFKPQPQQSLQAVCDKLGFDGDMAVLCVLFVGNFDNNAFAFTHGGTPVVNFPVEGDPTGREATIAHELTHVVHDRLSEAAGGYVIAVAKLVLMEGIAMWTSKAVAPGYPDKEYLGEFTPGWMDRCQANHRAILAGIRPQLAAKNEEAMWRFTMGTGTTGCDREVYWTGWHVVEHLLKQGRTLAELARIKEEEAPALVDATLAELLG